MFIDEARATIETLGLWISVMNNFLIEFCSSLATDEKKDDL